MKAIRDPKHWRPDFKAWSQLGHSFEGLKSKLKESGKVYALKGRSIELFSDFSNNAANAYDRPALDDSWRPKCALLNITRVLEGERIPARQGMWFSRVQRIRAVSGERVIAVVEAETFREVDELASSRQIDVFDCGSYAWAPGREHKRNFVNADGTRAKIKDWRSVKSPICRGNLQLTVARTEGGETLADIDMDENRTMLRHLADMYKHKWTGGTDPVQIGQVLKIHNPQLDLGYTFTQV
jgi:hypothetical protein